MNLECSPTRFVVMGLQERLIKTTLTLLLRTENKNACWLNLFIKSNKTCITDEVPLLIAVIERVIQI